jgi:two-component system, sensor histidine kinase LadS
VALAWALVPATATAQDLRPGAAVQSVAALPAIVLSPQQPVVSLSGRSLYWIDASTVRTAENLAANDASVPWKLREAGQTLNIDGKALWIQFDAQSSGDSHWFVEFASSGIDRVQFIYRGPDGKWIEQEAGDTRPVSMWPLPGRFPTFELLPATGEPVRYWLRVEHARVDFASPITIYEQSALFASRESEQFLLGGYFGLAALIAFISFASAIVYRDRNFGVYATYVGALALGQLAYLGVGAQHVWTQQLKWNETATFVLPGISSAIGLWFARTVTEPARFSRALDLMVWALIAAVLSAVAVDTVIASRASFALVLYLTLLSLATVVGLILLVWKQADEPHIRLIALGFLPVIVMAIFPIARGLNLIVAGPLTRYGLTIGAAIEMPILYYALSLRSSRRREGHMRAATLTHNDPLTGLAHGQALMQRLSDALSRARNLRHACGLMAVKISNFDALVSEYGRDTADRALVVTASLLRRAITDVDLAARIGENAFALLLEGPTTTENAISRAQQVVASGLRQAEALPAGTTLKFHVSVALLPDNDLDGEGSMKWLLDAVNAMPSDARKLIRPLNF